MKNISQKELGQRIEARRKANRMTLKQLSAESGISAGFLSKIENGLCNPSISVIQKICFALQVSVNELAAVKTEAELMSTIHKNQTYLLRKDERCLIYGFGDTFRLETLYERAPLLKVNAMTLLAGQSEQTHCVQTYDNFGIVAQGSMAIDLEDGTHFTLDEGDCIMVRAKQQHSITNLTNAPCISYWIEVKE